MIMTTKTVNGVIDSLFYLSNFIFHFILEIETRDETLDDSSDNCGTVASSNPFDLLLSDE